MKYNTFTVKVQRTGGKSKELYFIYLPKSLWVAWHIKRGQPLELNFDLQSVIIHKLEEQQPQESTTPPNKEANQQQEETEEDIDIDELLGS